MAISKVTIHSGGQAWLKVSPKGKAAWRAAEFGSFEDSGMASSHVYNNLGSYKSTLYVGNLEELIKIVKSLSTCALSDSQPALFKGLRNGMLDLVAAYPMVDDLRDVLTKRLKDA